jgi:hypothetical protein
MDGKVSLHDPHTGKRLTQSATLADCRPIKLLRWKTRLVPSPPPYKERLLPSRSGRAGYPQAEDL